LKYTISVFLVSHPPIAEALGLARLRRYGAVLE